MVGRGGSTRGQGGTGVVLPCYGAMRVRRDGARMRWCWQGRGLVGASGQREGQAFTISSYPWTAIMRGAKVDVTFLRERWRPRALQVSSVAGARGGSRLVWIGAPGVGAGKYPL